MNVPNKLVRFGLILGASVVTTCLSTSAAIARDNSAGIGYSGRDTSYCSTTLTASNRNSRINVREGPGTVYNDRHYGYSGDWVDILNENGNPNIWRSGQDNNSYVWYQIGFPASGAYGWVREDFLTFPPEDCRN